MKAKKDYKSEVFDIVKTKDWDKARWSNDINLYYYIKRHKDTNENCRIIWEHINQQSRDFELEISEIIETKDWDRARCSNDINLYGYIKRHKDTNENCRIIWEHISRQSKDFKTEVLEIIETKDWDRARWSNNTNLYQYVKDHKDTDENCKIIWEHIKAERKHHSIKDYLLYYFKYGKPTISNNKNLCIWFIKQINKDNQCCIDVKNLIVAAETYQDPVALETLELIKNHLEDKEGD
jgi:predicted lipoprotein with Yx(FWY)xxD motif